MKGFTLIELMIVMGIVALVSIITIPNFLQTQNIDKLERAAYKIKYDIAYVQSLSYSSTVPYRFAIAFGTTAGGVNVAGGLPSCDYVCFEDKNGNRVPDSNEIITDSATQMLMMYKFSDPTASNAGKVFGDFIMPLTCEFHWDNTAGNIRNTIFFDNLGTPKVYDGAIYQDLFNSATIRNEITVKLNDAANNRFLIMVYPLTASMRLVHQYN